LVGQPVVGLLDRRLTARELGFGHFAPLGFERELHAMGVQPLDLLDEPVEDLTVRAVRSSDRVGDGLVHVFYIGTEPAPT